MTMLDRMRRHKDILKWTLVIVVLSFIVFYIPSFLQTDAEGLAPTDAVATVGGESITVDAFRRAYQSQLQAYQRAYGSSLNEQFLKQMGIDQQILQQLIDERAAAAEAARLGLSVTDQEVAQRIFAIPAFQQNGQFAGQEVYRQILQMQRPPLTTNEFEENLRRALLVEKLRNALTDWISVTDSDVEREYRRRNEKVKMELVVFSADTMRDQATVSDAEVSKYFEEHKDQYRAGEKKKIRYLLADTDALKAKIVVPPGDVEKYYRENQQQYSTPEQVRASHILLKTEGKDEAAVKARAEALLKQAKSGGDFAELATKNSEDEGSAKQGGDLDYFSRGRMVKEFEDVAFSLPPGSISDLVKSQFGYHIIKVVDKKAATTKSLDEVRAQILDQLSYERAQAQASALGDTLAKEIKSPADLDKAAAAHGLKVQESGFFTRDEPIMGIGPSPEVSEQAFTAKEGTVAGPLRTARGPVFLTVVGTQAPRIPALAEVQEKVKEDAVRAKARDLSRTRAESLAADFKNDFTAAAKKAGLEVKTTELVARGSTLPVVGPSAAVDAAVFALPTGSVTAPVATDAGTVIARVVEKPDLSPQDLAAAKDGLRTDLQNERRNRFFSAYMQKARDKFKAEINQDLVRRVVG
jgi:peptidyl-prolyl cis-trans isomerase D